MCICVVCKVVKGGGEKVDSLPLYCCFWNISLVPSKGCHFFDLMEDFAEEQDGSHQQLGGVLSLWEGMSPGLQYLSSAVTGSWRKKYILAFFIALQNSVLHASVRSYHSLIFFLPLPQMFFMWAERDVLKNLSCNFPGNKLLCSLLT